MTVRILDLAGAERLLSLVGDIATVCTADPAPVGARVELRLDDAAAGPATGKVVDARKSGDGYRIRVRLFSLPRAVREALEKPGDSPGKR